MRGNETFLEINLNKSIIFLFFLFLLDQIICLIVQIIHYINNISFIRRSRFERNAYHPPLPLLFRPQSNVAKNSFRSYHKPRRECTKRLRGDKGEGVEECGGNNNGKVIRWPLNAIKPAIIRQKKMKRWKNLRSFGGEERESPPRDPSSKGDERERERFSRRENCLAADRLHAFEGHERAKRRSEKACPLSRRGRQGNRISLFAFERGVNLLARSLIYYFQEMKGVCCCVI